MNKIDEYLNRQILELTRKSRAEYVQYLRSVHINIDINKGIPCVYDPAYLGTTNDGRNIYSDIKCRQCKDKECPFRAEDYEE